MHRAVLLAGLSAFAAGAHEVVWSRLLGRAVGNTAIGVGLTLAAFMIGSGAGALLVPRFALWRRVRLGYAGAELAIGVGALLLLFYGLYLPPPSAWLGLGVAADVLLAGAISCLPALAMGATYPLLVEATATEGRRPVRLLYVAGLGGVVAGTLGGAIVLGPAIGLGRLAVAAAALNVVLSVLALRWLPKTGSPKADAPREISGMRASLEDRDAVARFAAAGILGLAAQTVWNRVALPYAGVSTFTFASIVAVYVLAQACGFALHQRFGAGHDRVLGNVSLALAPVLVIASFGLVSPGVQLPSQEGSPVAWFGGMGAIVMAVVGPPAFLLGISQASALYGVEQRAAGWGRRAGVVAGIGTIASALGALFASLVGMATVGPRWTIVLASVPIVVVAGRRAPALTAGAAIAAVALAALSPGPRWFLGTSYDDAPVYYAEHGVQDTTAVIAVDLPVQPRSRFLVANGVSYASDIVYAQRYMRLLAHLPALAAHEEETALVICVGTGTTLDALRAYDFERIDAVDISPSIRRTLRFFAHVNNGFEDDDRVRFVVDDGARYLRRTDVRYDVITLEPPPPRAPGASSLYSMEFYEAARARLKPGGALAQWLPLHGMSGAELAALVRTFVRTFEHATLHLSERNEAVLLGVLGARGTDVGTDPAPTERISRASVQRDLGRIGAGAQNLLYDTYVLSGSRLAAAAGEGEVVRDLWPMPEFAPLAGANEGVLAADEFVERLLAASEAHPGTFAALLLPAVPSYLRKERRRDDAWDRAVVIRAMRAWLERDPADPYVQHVFGFGPLLEGRLERVAKELSREEEERLRAFMAAQRRSVLDVRDPPLAIQLDRVAPF